MTIHLLILLLILIFILLKITLLGIYDLKAHCKMSWKKSVFSQLLYKIFCNIIITAHVLQIREKLRKILPLATQYHKMFTHHCLWWEHRICIRLLLLKICNFFRCQYYLHRHPWVPAYQGVITFFVLANFTLATFMDPGVIPKGWCKTFINLI